MRLVAWIREGVGVSMKQSKEMRVWGQDSALSPLPSSCANSISH